MMRGSSGRSAGAPSSMTTTCFTVVRLGRYLANNGSSERSTKNTSSSAWLAVKMNCSGRVAQVAGVHDPPGARNGEVELQVPGGVPRERADPGVGCEPERIERAADRACPGRQIGEGHPLQARSRPRRDRPFAEVLLAAREDPVGGQRHVLHQSKHGRNRARCGPDRQQVSQLSSAIFWSVTRRSPALSRRPSTPISTTG